MATQEVTAEPQRTLPTAASGVTVTPNATAWVNSAYTELTASIGSAVTIIGVIITPVNAVGISEVEIDIARGAGASEVVVATYIVALKGSPAGSNLLGISNIPIDDIASGQRIAVRMRKAGTSVATWAFKLIYYNSVSATVGVTANESLAAPSAAAGVSLTPSGTAWVNSAYGELSASLTDVVALGLAVYLDGAVVSGGTEFEIDLAIGAAASEVVEATLGGASRQSTLQGFNPLISFRLPISLPGTNRMSCRMRKNGTDTTVWTVKLLYISASGFGTSAIQYTSQPQRISPDAAELPTVAGSMTAWANSAYVQIIASTATAIVIVASTVDTAANFSYESDTAKGAATAEAVVASDGDHRAGAGGTNWSVPFFIPIDNIAVSTRVAMRHRDSDSTANTQALGLTYYEKSL
jgi:hypothetical protein